MFERWDEQARRSIFFARAEASNFGSSWIDTEHLLLGIMHEDFHLRKELPGRAIDQIRAEIERLTPSPRSGIPTLVDMPLSTASKRALAFAADEVERSGNRLLNPGHLVLGLLRVTDCMAADLLRLGGIDIPSYRSVLEKYR
jgi:ATP-dependent Clp protease ATP-binding subunit ClpC